MLDSFATDRRDLEQSELQPVPIAGPPRHEAPKDLFQITEIGCDRLDLRVRQVMSDRLHDG
jgi:hypothetical protein